jgi:hypothetical protein
MPWKLAVPSPLERENDTLKTIIVCLRADVRNRENQIHRLELVLRQRSERIDELTGKVDRLRDQNRKLDEENEHLCEMVRLSPDPF